MIFDDIILLMRQRLDDVDKTRFENDNVLIEALNESILFIQRTINANGIHLNTASKTLSFVANTQEVSLSIDESKEFARHISLIDSANIPISIYSQVQVPSATKRCVYIRRKQELFGNLVYSIITFGWYIVPTSSFDLTLWYEKIIPYDPGLPLKRAIGLIPDNHVDVVMLYAILLLLGIQKDVDNFWVQQFQSTFQSMIETISPQNINAEEVVDAYY